MLQLRITCSVWDDRKGLAQRGFTIVEAMIALAITSVAFGGTILGFRHVSKAIGKPRSRQVGVNLARAQMETLRNISYYKLTPTTSAALADPNDATNPFPPDIVAVENQNFTVKTVVTKLDETSGLLTNLNPGDLEKNLKKVQVQVDWAEEGSTQSLTLMTMYNNILPVDRPGRIQGTVYNSSGTAISLVRVYIQEDPSWTDCVDGTGFYSIRTNLATWTVVAESWGYDESISASLIVSDSNPATLNLTLTLKAVGNINGNVYTAAGSGRSNAVVTVLDGDVPGVLAGSGGAYTLPYVEPGTGFTLVAVYSNDSVERFDMTLTVGTTLTVNLTLGSNNFTKGLLQGTVQKGSTNLSNIVVEVEDYEVVTNGSGKYYLVLPPDDYSMTANPDRLNGNYEEGEEEDEVTVSAGTDTTKNFDLKATGKMSGKVTTNGTEALPNVIVSAMFEGDEVDADVTDSLGNFTVTVPEESTDYVLVPTLDTKESCSPVGYTLDIDDGDNFTGKDFTISTVSGQITGSVTDGGSAVSTGALVMACTASIDTSAPPQVDNTFATGSTVYYGTTSVSDGSYTLNVRRGQVYYLYCWYTKVTSGVPVTAVKSLTSVTLSSGAIAGKDFSFP